MPPPDLTDHPPRRSAIILNTVDARANCITPFWTAGVGVGVNVILSQLGEIDALAQRISVLPPRAMAGRDMLGDYLDTIAQLAVAWLQRSRPVLLHALRVLHAFGDSLDSHDAGRLGAQPGFHESARLLDSMAGRLDTIAASLESLNADIGHYLEHMAIASSQLETDTMLVTHRLQADQVHASMLAEQLDAFQLRLEDARTRQHQQLPLSWPLGWPLSGEAELVRREIADHSAALDRARRQLERIRSGQSETLLDAAFLQQLLPTLSSYLAGVDRMGAGVDATLLGLRALQTRMRELIAALLSGSGVITAQQLDAALPHWRHLAARLAALPG